MSKTIPELKWKLRNEKEKKKIKSKEVDENKFSIDWDGNIGKSIHKKREKTEKKGIETDCCL